MASVTTLTTTPAASMMAATVVRRVSGLPFRPNTAKRSGAIVIVYRAHSVFVVVVTVVAVIVVVAMCWF